jgi:hypothetical protein
MNLGCQVSEDYMVLAFLRGELVSSRWHYLVKLTLLHQRHPQALIDTPDLANEEENAARAGVLCYRGYGYDAGLFEGFPTDVVWRLAMCEPSELRLIGEVDSPSFQPDDTEIIVAGESVDDLVVLEGNARVKQGYRLPAIVGLSPSMSKWKYYS